MWKFFVKSPKFTLLLVGALTLLGVFSIFDINKESNPDVEIPFVIVSTAFPGANALDVERFVTEKIEDGVLGIEDVRKVTSSSGMGFSSVAIEFEIGTDIDKRIRDIENAISLRRLEFPTDASDSIVRQVDFADRPIKVFALSGPYDANQLRYFGDELASRLDRVAGLNEVRVEGGQERQVQVLVNNEDLLRYGLSFAQVTNAISTASSNIPIGEIERNNRLYSLRFEATLDDLEELSRVMIRGGNSPVSLRDIAIIRDTYADPRSKSFFGDGDNLYSAVSLSLFKTSAGDVLTVVDEADRVIEEAFDDLLPENLVIEVTDDMAEYIRTDLMNLALSGLQTTLIVILLIFLLLGWRESLLAGISIPLTFLITFIALNNLGYTLNFLSLFSLILALGILVDAAIVMTEAIYENKQKGMSPEEAAFQAIDTFKSPLISGTLTTVFAFLPMMLTSGIIGEFIKSIPVTVSLVLFSALFVALAVIPTLFVILLNRKSKGRKFNIWYFRLFLLFTLFLANNIIIYLIIVAIILMTYLPDSLILAVRRKFNLISRRLQAGFDNFVRKRDYVVSLVRERYRRSLESHLRFVGLRRKLFILLVLGFFGSLALPGFGILKVDMFPAVDMERVYVDIRLPAGDTLEVTENYAVIAESFFAEQDDIESYLMNIGAGSSVSGGSGSNIGSFTLNLRDGNRRDSRELLEIYDRELSELLPGANIIVQQLGSGPEQGAPIAIQIKGQDLDELDRLSSEVLARVRDLEFTRSVQNLVEESPGEIVFSVDRSVLALYGVQPSQLALLARSAVFGQDITTIRIDGDDIDVIVRYDIAENSESDISLERLSSLTVQTSRGNIPLGSLVEVSFAPNRLTINREDGERVVTITSDITSSIAIQDAFARIQDELSNVTIPEGYALSVGGQNEDTDQSFADLGRAMIIGIFMIAGLLVLQFNSFRQPLIVISSIPLSLIGVLTGLTIIGQPLSFPGMIGVVALAGIVVNNGIILVDRINEARGSGLLMEEAILEAGVSRLRPIILTTITTIAGLLPLVLTQPSWAPLGFAIIFGLLFSTILTLLVVPLLYFIFAERELT